MKPIGLYIGLILLLVGCKKEIGPQSVNQDAIGSGKLIVLNEGNFGFGNASVSLYDPVKKEVSNNQFKAVNGYGIGDVLQSVSRYQDQFYFVVNNSGKVVVTDTNLRFIKEITGLNSPRYIEFIGNKGFVTDLKQKGIWVVDLSTNQVIDTIKTQGWTETMLIHNNKLLVLDRGDYLTNSGPNYVFIVNPSTFQKEDSIQVPTNPNSMVLDKNDKLWVLSSGNSTLEKPKLSQYNLSAPFNLKSFSFPTSSDSPSRLSINKTRDQLYFLNTSVYTHSITSTTFSPRLFFQKTTENFYGLYIVDGIDEVYVADAKNYNELGEVIRLNSSTQVLHKFSVGIIPQYMK